MRRVLLFLVALSLFTIKTQAQEPTLEWEKYWGNEVDRPVEMVKHILHTSKDEILVSGGAKGGSSDFMTDGIIIKLDSQRKVVGQKLYDFDGALEVDDYINKIIELSDGYLVLAETHAHNNTFLVTGRVLKMNENGEILWQKTLPMIGGIQDMVLTSDGGFMLGTVKWKEGNKEETEIKIFKFNAEAESVWGKVYGEAKNNYLERMENIGNGQYRIFTVQGENNTSAGDNIDYAIDEEGNVVSYRNTQKEKNMLATSDGGYIGGKEIKGEGYYDPVSFELFKYDKNGNLMFSKVYGAESKNYYINSIIEAEDEGYLMLAEVYDLGYYERTAAYHKLDTKGEIVWVYNKAAKNEECIGVQSIGDKKYLTGGIFKANTLGHAWAAILKDNHSFKGLGLEETQPLAKTVSVYPNPTQDYVYIKLSAGESLKKLSVADVSGRVFTPIWEGNKVNLSALSAGVYFLKIETTGRVYTEKIIKK